MYFHSCFASVDVTVTLGLVDLLNMPILTDPCITSPFDLWVHEGVFPVSQIIENGSETFNQL